MPELPEVETVRKVLESWVINKTIKRVYVYYDNIKRVEKMPSEHTMIMEAIKDGRSDAARAAAEMHIERIKEMVMNDTVRHDFK